MLHDTIGVIVWYRRVVPGRFVFCSCFEFSCFEFLHVLQLISGAVDVRLFIMGFSDQFKEAKQWVKDNLMERALPEVSVAAGRNRSKGCGNLSLLVIIDK